MDHERCFGAIFRCNFDLPINRPSVEAEFILATREAAELIMAFGKKVIFVREIVDVQIIDAISNGAVRFLGTITKSHPQAVRGFDETFC